MKTQPSKNKGNNDSEWSDSKSWWMDLLKSFLGYALGAIITIFVFILTIDRFQHKWQAEYDIKLDVLKEYEKASLKSLLSSYDALKDSRRNGQERSLSEEIRKWEDEIYDDMFLAEKNIRYWFEINNDEQIKLRESLLVLDSLRKIIKIDFDNGLHEYNKYATDSLREAAWLTYKTQTWEPIKSRYLAMDSIVSKECRHILIEDN